MSEVSFLIKKDKITHSLIFTYNLEALRLPETPETERYNLKTELVKAVLSDLTRMTVAERQEVHSNRLLSNPTAVVEHSKSKSRLVVERLCLSTEN